MNNSDCEVLQEHILRCLNDGPKGLNDLAGFDIYRRSQVYEILNRLECKGLIRSCGDGWQAITRMKVRKSKFSTADGLVT